jgi:transcriptional regulator with PAS, ATPase and Fis domain
MIINGNKHSIYFFKATSFFVFSLIFIFSMSLLVACQSKSQPEVNKPASNITAVDACDIISQQDVEQIFNVSVKDVKNTIQNSASNGQSFASQCTYYIESNSFKTVAVMVNYSAKETSPKTFDELVARNTPKMGDVTEEQKKILDEIKNSFLIGTKITDTDKIGVWYNWAEAPSLMIYFKDNYQLIINLIGFEYNNDNMEACKKIAEKLISTLK